MLPGMSSAGICAEKRREGVPASQLSEIQWRGRTTAGIILMEDSKTDEEWGYGFGQ